jgi:hypothetical protein
MAPENIKHRPHCRQLNKNFKITKCAKGQENIQSTYKNKSFESDIKDAIEDVSIRPRN